MFYVLIKVFNKTLEVIQSPIKSKTFDLSIIQTDGLIIGKDGER